MALVLSAMSVFLIWGIPSVHAAIVGVSCVFSAVTVTVFGSLDVVNMNIYDITVRWACVCVCGGGGGGGGRTPEVPPGPLLLGEN